MTASDSNHTSDRLKQDGILENCATGLKVLAAELGVMLSGMLRGHENKQIKKRLEAEYASLGRLARKHIENNGSTPMSTDGEAGIILSQIAFMEKEMEFMAEDAQRSREESRHEMRRRLGQEESN